MNKNLHCLKFFVFLCVFALNSYAQTPKSTLSGVVKTKDGVPASHVTVSVKPSSKATYTDDNGKFQIKNLSLGKYALIISGVGISRYEIEVTVKEGDNVVPTVFLAEAASQLSEVEISGYKSPNRKLANLGKSGIAPRDLPQSVQIITSQVIQDQQADRLGDVMKNVNGVALGANRGGVGENFYARGYSLGANNVFKNGARTS
ncbi:MAG: TonB-dependent siderophore receptor, partial [Chitinophagaceae bacterium]